MMELQGKKINFLGDSITEGCGVSTLDKTFWNVMAHESGIIARGYGVGGTRIARKRNPSPDPVHDRDFLMRCEEMDRDADAVVVFGGTNDFAHGDAALGTFADRSPYTFYGALHLLCRRLLELYPDAQLVFMTPTHRIGEDMTVNEIGLPLATDLEGFGEAIKKVCRYYSIPVLDLFSVSGIQPAVPIMMEKYMCDGLHLSDAGHKRVANLLTGFLKAL